MAKDWRDDDAYEHFDTLSLAGFAWECLRRNDRYREAYPLLKEGIGTPADWGLRFRGRSCA
ncbi:DUF6499 domain-containing protein [Maricaulis sp.]|uniref:transcriptional regulator domain-containing protein n=1 Tax=Maricaulis sp. TaxID=1486257 RepID=UPI0032983F6F